VSGTSGAVMRSIVDCQSRRPRRHARRTAGGWFDASGDRATSAVAQPACRHRRYRGIGPCSSTKAPVAPEPFTCASRTMIAAPCDSACWSHLGRSTEQLLRGLDLALVAVSALGTWASRACCPASGSRSGAAVPARERRGRELRRRRGNPAAHLKKLRESYEATRYQFFTPDQVHQLAEAAVSEQDAALFVTAAFTGLRRGELVALRWPDVDFENQWIRVYEGFTRELGRPQSRRSWTVPMVDEVAQALHALWTRRGYTGPDDFAFPRGEGRHQRSISAPPALSVAVERAALARLRFHDLRHTFGSLGSAAAVLSPRHSARRRYAASLGNRSATIRRMNHRCLPSLGRSKARPSVQPIRTCQMPGAPRAHSGHGAVCTRAVAMTGG
jgi:integrase